jgi:hypothetical protein
MTRLDYITIRKTVEKLFSEADAYNSANVRRFFPMLGHKDGKMVEFGMYDYQTKKYVLFDIYSLDQQAQLREFEEFFESSKAIPVKR